MSLRHPARHATLVLAAHVEPFGSLAERSQAAPTSTSARSRARAIRRSRPRSGSPTDPAARARAPTARSPLFGAPSGRRTSRTRRTRTATSLPHPRRPRAWRASASLCRCARTPVPARPIRAVLLSWCRAGVGCAVALETAQATSRIARSREAHKHNSAVPARLSSRKGPTAVGSAAAHPKILGGTTSTAQYLPRAWDASPCRVYFLDDRALTSSRRAPCSATGTRMLASPTSTCRAT